MSKNVTPLYMLADHLEHKVKDEDFDMESWATCIAGHACRSHHKRLNEDTAAAILGLDYITAAALFIHPLISTRQQAAWVLRRLAETGRVPEPKDFPWFKDRRPASLS